MKNAVGAPAPDPEERRILLWQIADLLGQYARARQWWRTHP